MSVAISMQILPQLWLNTLSFLDGRNCMFMEEAFSIAGLPQTLPLHTCREALSASCLAQEHSARRQLAWARHFSFTMPSYQV